MAQAQKVTGLNSGNCFFFVIWSNRFTDFVQS